MKGASRGHELFEAWLIQTYGVSTRSPGRPLFTGLKAARKAIAVELKAIAAEFAAEQAGLRVHFRAPRQPIGLYHWLASAKPSTRRGTPPHIRLAIERVTAGAVPRDSWDEPASETVAAA